MEKSKLVQVANDILFYGRAIEFYKVAKLIRINNRIAVRKFRSISVGHEIELMNLAYASEFILKAILLKRGVIVDLERKLGDFGHNIYKMALSVGFDIDENEANFIKYCIEHGRYPGLVSIDSNGDPCGNNPNLGTIPGLVSGYLYPVGNESVAAGIKVGLLPSIRKIVIKLIKLYDTEYSNIKPSLMYRRSIR